MYENVQGNGIWLLFCLTVLRRFGFYHVCPALYFVFLYSVCFFFIYKYNLYSSYQFSSEMFYCDGLILVNFIHNSNSAFAFRKQSESLRPW